MIDVERFNWLELMIGRKTIEANCINKRPVPISFGKRWPTEKYSITGRYAPGNEIIWDSLQIGSLREVILFLFFN